MSSCRLQTVPYQDRPVAHSALQLIKTIHTSTSFAEKDKLFELHGWAKSHEYCIDNTMDVMDHAPSITYWVVYSGAYWGGLLGGPIGSLCLLLWSPLVFKLVLTVISLTQSPKLQRECTESQAWLVQLELSDFFNAADNSAAWGFV